MRARSCSRIHGIDASASPNHAKTFSLKSWLSTLVKYGSAHVFASSKTTTRPDSGSATVTTASPVSAQASSEEGVLPDICPALCIENWETLANMGWAVKLVMFMWKVKLWKAPLSSQISERQG